MDTITDDELRLRFGTKRTELNIQDEGPPPEPVDLACRFCGGRIPFPSDRNNRRVVTAWNDLATQPPRFACKVCAEAEKQRRDREAAEAIIANRQADVDAVRANLPAALARCGVPAHWRGASLGECVDLPGKLVEAARQWAESPFGIVLLYGPPGAGKSYLAVAMLRAVLESGTLPPASCRYIAEREFLDELKAGFDPDAKPISPRLLPPDHPRRVGLLLYDDMGAARQTDWSRGEVAALIEHRHADGLPTIITSNLDLPELSKAIDGRISSRIAEYGQVWQFPSRDLRITGTLTPEPPEKKN